MRALILLIALAACAEQAPYVPPPAIAYVPARLNQDQARYIDADAFDAAALAGRQIAIAQACGLIEAPQAATMIAQARRRAMSSQITPAGAERATNRGSADAPTSRDCNESKSDIARLTTALRPWRTAPPIRELAVPALTAPATESAAQAIPKMAPATTSVVPRIRPGSQVAAVQGTEATSYLANGLLHCGHATPDEVASVLADQRRVSRRFGLTEAEIDTLFAQGRARATGGNAVACLAVTKHRDEMRQNLDMPALPPIAAPPIKQADMEI